MWIKTNFTTNKIHKCVGKLYLEDVKKLERVKKSFSLKWQVWKEIEKIGKCSFPMKGITRA